MARAALSWDFAKEDATPEIGLNQAIWKSVKGRHSKMPRPRPRHDLTSARSQNDEEEAEEESR